MHRFVDPPTQQDEERHPEEGELDAEVDGPGLCELGDLDGLDARDGFDEGACKVGDGDDAVGGEGDDGEQHETKPSAAGQCWSDDSALAEVRTPSVSR